VTAGWSPPPETPAAGPERRIAQLGAVFAIGILAAALALGYWGVARAPALIARDDNPRRIERERRVRRGDIFDRQGRPLVRSEPGPNGTWERVYLAPEAAPVVGYYSINLGTGGVEGAHDPEIRGEPEPGQPGASAERMRDDLLHRHPAGVPVTLTIDLDLQRTANQALGARAGAVVLLDVQRGDVLAMVSHPTYDPNTLEADWPDLVRASDKPMLNRASQGLYPPGPIFQTVTLVAAMQEGLAGPTTVFTDDLGVILTVDPPISCPSEPPQGAFTLAEAYSWPCSVLFARLGLEMGGERLADYATQLGVGRPLDLPVEVSTGQLLERGVWSDLLAGRTAMGQGEVLVTPLEMALMTATLANDGLRPVPRLVRAVGGQGLPAGGGLPAGEAPQPVLSPQVAQQARAVLAQAYQAGRRGTSLPVADVAGLAGSADSGQPGAPPHAWFIGYAPAAAPRYAVVVIVEHGERGWQVAAPIGVRVLEQAKGVE
jgi:peptidoglycan glycosyltransferase